MIMERESHFCQEDLSNPLYFPKYIVVRRSIETSSEDRNEW